MLPGSGAHWRVVCNLGYALALVVAAVVPDPGAVGGVAPDWVAHAAAYAVEAGLLFWLIRPPASLRSRAVGAWAGASALGMLTEGLQLLVAARSAELTDLAADAVGAGLAVGLLALAIGRAGRGAEGVA